MLSNIVYTYIYKSVIFDKSYITLLLINKLLSNRFNNNEKTNLKRIFQIINQFKSFKNNMFEVLSSRILFNIVSFLLLMLTYNNK